ncbi:MAG: hypothetical protein AABX11_06680, partial [Nanoarchaeota archaeon]
MRENKISSLEVRQTEESMHKMLESKAREIKRKALGFCGKISFKTEAGFARILQSTGICRSVEEAVREVRYLPDILKISYGTAHRAIGPDYLQIMRLKNPLFDCDSQYKFQLIKSQRIGID